MLEAHESLCGQRARIVVSRDRGDSCQHRAINEQRNMVRQYRIDGNVVNGNESKRFDVLVLNDERKRAYLIELKSYGHLRDAILQFDAMRKTLEEDLRGYQLFYRVIYNARTHHVNDSNLLTWKTKKGCIGKVPVAYFANRKYEENIDWE